MLVASIREKKNNYYINLNQKDNEYEWQVVCANNSKTYTLEEEEAKGIINKMFDSNLTYLRKEKDYTIYLDEANNKRYFKNNKEDYEMFFLNNGKSAVMYEEGQTKEIVNVSKIWNNVKNFVMKKENVAIRYTSTFLLSSVLTTASLIYVPKFLFPNDSSLCLDDMTKYIWDSNNQNLTTNMKKYFINNELFNDILEVSDLSRDFILRTKLNNFGIAYYTETEKVMMRNFKGYYIISDPNHIHLEDSNVATFNDVASHEFIHLLQDSNQYNYIKEASAEIIAHEYYNKSTNSYLDARKRVYILMEMMALRK